MVFLGANDFPVKAPLPCFGRRVSESLGQRNSENPYTWQAQPATGGGGGAPAGATVPPVEDAALWRAATASSTYSVHFGVERALDGGADPRVFYRSADRVRLSLALSLSRPLALSPSRSLALSLSRSLALALARVLSRSRGGPAGTLPQRRPGFSLSLWLPLSLSRPLALSRSRCCSLLTAGATPLVLACRRRRRRRAASLPPSSGALIDVQAISARAHARTQMNSLTHSLPYSHTQMHAHSRARAQ
jgi:hypothetical protein